MNALLIQPVTVDELKQLLTTAVRQELEAYWPNEAEPAEPRYMTRDEAAKLLGVSLVTIDKWSNEGTLQKFRIGGRIRFKTAELHKALGQVKNLKYKRP
ncbi:MAG: helix-turn-helix domain-containing protein [Bacteroidetes bacterium]|nr:helix-turn-helix domain-containing protein [Bacteroidota bacterium]